MCGEAWPANIQTCLGLPSLGGMAKLKIFQNERLIDFEWNKSVFLKLTPILLSYRLKYLLSSRIAEFFDHQNL